MRNLIHKILKSLNINGRDRAILLPALLLAFSIWMIHNLSLKYNDYLKVYVIAKCEIPGHADISANRCEVIARCRATGYKMIRSAIKSGKSINVIFKPSDIRHKEGDMFYVISSDLIEYASHMYGADVTVDHFMTDTLFFRFPAVHNKKVPVVPVSLLTFESQYMSRGELQILPDSVVVEGEPSLLESVHQVYTTPIRHLDVSENINGLALLEQIRGIHVETQEIYYSLEVCRYVEVVKEIPVAIEGVPSDRKLMVFPSTVTVLMKCEFPLLDNNDGNLKAYVDYSDFSTSLGGNCLVKLASLPKGVISYEIDPVAVRCVEEER